MTSSLKTGICVSLAMHAAVAIGVINLRSQPGLPGGITDDAVTITLISGETLEKVLSPPPEERPPPIAEPVAQEPPPLPPEPEPMPIAEPEPPKPEEPVAAAVVPAPVEAPSVTTEPVRRQQAVAVAAVAAPLPRAAIETKTASPGSTRARYEAPAGIRATPAYRVNPEPPYPAAARRRRQEGLVLLTVMVSPQGRARSVKLKESSGFPLLDEVAQNAVSDWEFIPGRMGTVAVESEIEVPVRFKLNR